MATTTTTGRPRAIRFQAGDRALSRVRTRGQAFRPAERTQEGELIRTPVELKLVRGSTPVFFLTWTVMHCIDEASPFYGEDATLRLQASGAQLYVMLTGYDQTVGQTVHAYHEYRFSDIVYDARFVDIVGASPDGIRTIDFARFHDVEAIGSG